MKNYFSHDSDARNDEKMVRLRMKHGAAGYGVYFMILERLRESTNYMCVKDYNMIAFDLRVDAALVKSVVEDYGLFVFTDNREYFYSESFLKRMNESDTRKKKLSDAGRAGMARRWTKSNDDAEEQLQKDEENDTHTKRLESVMKKDIHGRSNYEYARQITDKYNELIVKEKSSLRPVRVVTLDRIEAIMDIYKKFPNSADIITALRNAVKSDFLNGKTKKRSTPADFDWIIKPKNFLKCLEGTI